MLTFQECVRDAQIFRFTDKSRPEILLLSFRCARMRGGVAAGPGVAGLRPRGCGQAERSWSPGSDGRSPFPAPAARPSFLRCFCRPRH